MTVGKREKGDSMDGATLTGLLKKGQKILAEAGIEEAGLDAWLLLEYITGKSRAYYFAHGEECVTNENADRYLKLIHRRADHIPLQHLTHQAFFMGYEFYVDEHVLVPRQDTETLVEAGSECMKEKSDPRILDMCTGSGCILLSLLKEIPGATGTGVDLSKQALEVAKRNAASLEVTDRAVFIESDLFSNISSDPLQVDHTEEKRNICETDGPGRDWDSESVPVYDMIISNPPYIPTAQIEELMEEVRLHDPRMALDGMEDGLYFYRTITKQAMRFLAPGGWLLYEIGCSQGKEVKSLLETEGFSKIQIRQDLCGLDRVVLGQKGSQEDKDV